MALCVYCGTREGNTKDHAPPRCMFPPGAKRLDLVTVPACEECHKELGKDAEFMKVALVLPAEAYNTTLGRALWENVVHKSTLRKNARLRRELQERLDLFPHPEGGRAFGVPIEAEKIHAFAVRLVKALTWEEYKEILPPGTEFSFFWQDSIRFWKFFPQDFLRFRASGLSGTKEYSCTDVPGMRVTGRFLFGFSVSGVAP